MKLGQALTLTFLFYAWNQLKRICSGGLPGTPVTHADNPQTVDEILGEGEVLLTLTDQQLEVAGYFTGMSSAATSAHFTTARPHSLVLSFKCSRLTRPPTERSGLFLNSPTSNSLPCATMRSMFRFTAKTTPLVN